MLLKRAVAILSAILLCGSIVCSPCNNIATSSIVSSAEGNINNISIVVNHCTYSIPANSSGFNITWGSLPGADGYSLSVYDSSKKDYVLLKKFNANTRSYYFKKNVKPGKVFKFLIKARLNDSYQPIIYMNIVVKPNAPSVKISSSSHSKSVLTWNGVSGANGYIVYFKSGNSYKKIKTLKVNKSNKYKFVKSGLKKGGTYKFVIKSYKTVNGKNYISSATYKTIKIR